MTEARTARLDAQQVADAVRDRAGVPLSVGGACPGGQVGAAYVRWPDGRRGVLTWRPGVTLGQVSNGPLAVPALLRATGYPAPATQLAVQVSDGVAMVQERLPGTVVQQVDTALLDQALALIDRHAGSLAGHPEVPALPRYLRDDGPGYCLHGPLVRFSPRAARLERRIAAIGGQSRLDTILDQLPGEVLAPAWAHMSLRMTDWAIRHFDPADVPYWLDLAETRL
jgi:hypothetical protein